MDDDQLSLYQPEFFLAWETFVERIEEAFESEQLAAEEKRPLALSRRGTFLQISRLPTYSKA